MQIRFARVVGGGKQSIRLPLRRARASGFSLYIRGPWAESARWPANGRRSP